MDRGVCQCFVWIVVFASALDNLCEGLQRPEVGGERESQALKLRWRMRYLHKISSTKSTNSLALIFNSKNRLPSTLKPPKSNQLLRSYLKLHEPVKALLHFREVWRQNPPALDSFSLLFALKACAMGVCPRQGTQIHTFIIKFGLASIMHLQTCLMRVYSVSNALSDARRVFDEMPERNAVSWTILLSCYVEHQRTDTALELFRQMLANGVEADRVTITVALSACADRGALEMGKWIHSYIRRRQDGIDVDLSLENALIDMYAKCGNVEAARRVFDGMGTKDVTTWTSMIVGHALHGQANEALELFSQMKRKSERREKTNRQESIVPNDVAFIGVLIACSHAGLVNQAKLHFRSMTEDYNIEPREPHYGCMVDALCRAGLLDEAHDLIAKMPWGTNPVVWRTLLGACSLRGNLELGEKVRGKLLELDPHYAGDEVAMSNIYAGRGMWDEKIRVRDRTRERREAGRSSVEVGREVSEFASGDNEHPLMGEIRGVLECLADSMREIAASSWQACHDA